MAVLTMTFDVPETKVFDQKLFQQKLTDLVQFVIASLPDAERDETDYIMSNSVLMDAIKAGDEQIARGDIKTTNLDELWN